MGLRIKIAPDKAVDVPAAVEAEGEAAIDAYVLELSGLDLAARRAESAKLAADRRAKEEAEVNAARKKSEVAAAKALEGGGLIDLAPVTTTTKSRRGKRHVLTIQQGPPGR